jgi:hypothetical protein
VAAASGAATAVTLGGEMKPRWCLRMFDRPITQVRGRVDQFGLGQPALPALPSLELRGRVARWCASRMTLNPHARQEGIASRVGSGCDGSPDIILDADIS